MAFNASVGSGSPASEYFNYLEPSTTYYFEILAEPSAAQTKYPSCYTTGEYTGSWTTASESNYLSTYGYSFRGVIEDSSGTGNTAPAGQEVLVECYESGVPVGADTSTTGSGGTYEVSATFSWSGCSSFAIEYLNNGEYANGASGATIWLGHWNETIVTWAPQFVNFYVPQNFLSLYTPMVLDFTNDPYVTFDYTSTFYSETTSSWEFNGVGESAETETGNLLGLNTNSNPGKNLEYYAQYEVSGTATFNAIAERTAQITQWNYVGPPQTSNNSPSQSVDPVTPFYSGVGTNEVCWEAVPGGAAETHETTYSGSYQLSSSFNLDISVSLDVGVGVSVSAPVIDYSNSISNGGGSSWTMSYGIYVPSSGSTTYVYVYVQPGLTNQVGPIVHAWSGPVCP